MVPYGTIMVPYGTIWYHYGTIWHHMVPYATICYHRVPCGIMVPLWYHYGTIWYHYGTIRYHMVPLWYHYGTIWYPYVPYGRFFDQLFDFFIFSKKYKKCFPENICLFFSKTYFSIFGGQKKRGFLV